MGRYPLAVAVSLAVLLVGCGNAKRNHLGTAVWSDDDQEHAYTHLRYEVEMNAWPYPATGSEDRTERRHSLYVQNPDGSNKRAIYENRADLSERIYYMKSAGYLVTEVQTDSDYGPVRLEKVTLSGDVTTITTGNRRGDCVNFEGVPSPGGSMIAIFESSALTPGDDGDSNCEGMALSLRLLNALTLAEINRHDFEMTGSYLWSGMHWTPDNAVIVGGDDTYYRVTGSEVTEVAEPTCSNGPMTNSSYISATGEMITSGYDSNGDPAVEDFGTDTNPNSRFGCQ